MAQVNTIPGQPTNWPANLAAVSPGGSVPADNSPGLSTISSQTQSALPGVGPPIQSTNQSLTTFQTPWVATSTLKASAPGVPAGGVTQAS
jgi:hypothetical protein